jgi:hypothetical protein
MMPLRKATVAALAVGTALAVGAPAASAGIASPGQYPGAAVQNIGPVGGNTAYTAGPCGTAAGAEGMGGTAGTENQVCVAGGVSPIGPSVGQSAAIVGPRIIGGPTVIRTSIVSAGNGNGG